MDGGYGGFSISDTAANVSGAIDALNADGSVNAITLTDSGAPTLSLSAAQALNDATALSDITNADYSIAISDHAASVSTNFDALNADTRVSSITLTNSGTPILTLSAAQAVGDATAFAKITNASYAIGIADTAADVSAALDALNADPKVSSITLTDNGTPTLSLTVAQALDDTTALGEITNTDYAISISDTAANILANASALSANSRVSSVTVVDTAANVLANAGALAADSDVPAIAVVDTAADILSDAAALDDNPQVTSITAVDSAANILENSATLAALPKIAGQIVSDTATNVSGSIDALNADSDLGAIHLTDSGTPTLTLTAAQALDDQTALSKIDNGTYAIDIVDTAANVSSDLDALSTDPQVASITLTDSGTPTLTLTASQFLTDSSALADITNSSFARSRRELCWNFLTRLRAALRLSDHAARSMM